MGHIKCQKTSSSNIYGYGAYVFGGKAADKLKAILLSNGTILTQLPRDV